jgi:hypothetical protein
LKPPYGLAVLASLPCLAVAFPLPAIVVDGRFDDWKGVKAAVRDTVDARSPEIDVREVRVTHDADTLYLLVELEREVNLHTLHGTFALALDADGDASTGRAADGLPGVDVVVELSPPGAEGRPTAGARLLVPAAHDRWAPRSVYETGFAFAPSYASRRVELALRRGSRVGEGARLFLGDRVRGLVTFRGLRGERLEETSAFVHVLKERAPLEPVRVRWTADPIARAPQSSLRVLSWNVSRQAFLERPEPFARILGALRPDVVILDELPPESSAEQLARFMSAAVPGLAAPPGSDACAVEQPSCDEPAWRAVFGACGGRQRVAVAAPFDMSPVGALRWVDYPEPPLRALAGAEGGPESVDALMEDGVGTGGALLRVANRTLLAASVDLQCCGRAAGPEDRLRVIEVSAIRQALWSAVGAEKPDAVILAGDFNLVGSRVPLDVVSRNLDPGGDHLEVVEALQLDGRSNATWADPRVPFAPGRLDFMLYSESSLHLLDAFVFETDDLPEEWRARHGLQEGDSRAASDHMPIVADFRWK